MKTAINKKLAIVSATFVLLTQPVFGQSTFGLPDCGQWLVKDSKFKISDKAWLLGFMGGLSVMDNLSTGKDPMEKINSVEQIFLWMDNFCQKNPLGTVSSGGFVLFIELKAK